MDAAKAAVLAALLATALPPNAGVTSDGRATVEAGGHLAPGAVCLAAGPEYYAFPLVTTKNVPGTGLATGTAEVAVAPSAPFTVALAPDGSYRYRVAVSLERLRAPARGHLVAWVTTTDIDRVQRLGTLDETFRASGTVEWNKFLVVITLEPTDDPGATTWTGPVVLRGMSRSGMMHTMAGHGAFQQENCAAYGY